MPPGKPEGPASPRGDGPASPQVEASLLDWLALHLLPGLGPLQKHRVLEAFADPGEIAYRVTTSALRSVCRLNEKNLQTIGQARSVLRRRAEEELRQSERLGLRLVSLADPDYPAVFEQLPDAPVLLYTRGRLAQERVRVAVVGSRRPTSYGRRVAAGLAAALAARGIEVVSGGARGIDTCAHRGALEAEGSTVVVLGSGFRHPYPQENGRLFDRIAESGAVLSEFALDVPPKPENFPRRNRLISGLSAAVVVVEATPRSGSLSTAAHALEQGREVLAVPGLVSSEQSQGCHRLIQQGAKLVQNSQDILDELSPMYRAALPAIGAQPAVDRSAAPGDLTLDESTALSLLEGDVEPIHIDVLAERAPFGIARLQAALFGLVVRGEVEELTGRYYLSRPRGEP